MPGKDGFCKHLSLSLPREDQRLLPQQSDMCSYASSLQIKLLSSQRRAFLDLRDASPIAMEQLQRILGSPAIQRPCLQRHSCRKVWKLLWQLREHRTQAEKLRSRCKERKDRHERDEEGTDQQLVSEWKKRGGACASGVHPNSSSLPSRFPVTRTTTTRHDEIVPLRSCV